MRFPRISHCRLCRIQRGEFKAGHVVDLDGFKSLRSQRTVCWTCSNHSESPRSFWHLTIQETFSSIRGDSAKSAPSCSRIFPGQEKWKMSFLNSLSSQIISSCLLWSAEHKDSRPLSIEEPAKVQTRSETSHLFFHSTSDLPSCPFPALDGRNLPANGQNCGTWIFSNT